MQKITHLALSGGGIKGCAILGAIKHLVETEVIGDSIEEYVGSSVGGLFCLLLNIGYTCDELFDIMLNINFAEYRDIQFSAIFDQWGLDNGQTLMKLITSIIKQKGISPDITFIKLYESTHKILTLTGSELLKNEVHYFNCFRTPEMKVLDAIRITICFPIMFYPIKTSGNEKIYVDGGLFAPYPIDYFDNLGEKKKRLGIVIHNTYNIERIEDGEEYILTIINTLQERFEKFYFEKYRDESIIIEINNIHGMNFNLDKDLKINLFNIGYDAAKNFAQS